MTVRLGKPLAPCCPHPHVRRPTVLEAARLMTDRGIGGLMVRDDAKATIQHVEGYVFSNR